MKRSIAVGQLLITLYVWAAMLGIEDEKKRAGRSRAETTFMMQLNPDNTVCEREEGEQGREICSQTPPRYLDIYICQGSPKTRASMSPVQCNDPEAQPAGAKPRRDRYQWDLDRTTITGARLERGSTRGFNEARRSTA